MGSISKIKDQKPPLHLERNATNCTILNAGWFGGRTAPVFQMDGWKDVKFHLTFSY